MIEPDEVDVRRYAHTCGYLEMHSTATAMCITYFRTIDTYGVYQTIAVVVPDISGIVMYLHLGQHLGNR